MSSHIAWGLLSLCAWTAVFAADIRPTADEIANARGKLLGLMPPTQAGVFESIPNAEGDYVYEATSARPLVAGRSLRIEPDTIVKGLTTAICDQRWQFCEDRVLTGLGLYWRLKAIRPDRYWIGFIYQTGPGQFGAEALQDAWQAVDLQLNGRMVPCPTLSDPVQLAPGVWFAEAQSADAIALKEGDELALAANQGPLRAARLILHAKEFQRGAFRMRVNPGPNLFIQPTAAKLSADCAFLPAAGKSLRSPEDWSRKELAADTAEDLLRASDGRAVARCTLANPLPVAVEVDYDCVVRSHFMRAAGQDRARLTLPAHAQLTREVLFSTTPDDPAYSITAKVRAVKPVDLGWPAYDELAFLPGLRHLMPWPDPYEGEDHRRLFFYRYGTAGARQSVSLAGQWELAMTGDLNPPMPPPASLKFAPVWVPFCKTPEPQVHSAYVRRKFVLPEAAAPLGCRLLLGGVYNEGTLYVNGQKFGNVRGYNTPLIADVTRVLHPGENEILVLARDMIALMDPAYVQPEKPTLNTAFLDAPGLWGNTLGLDAIWLELAPLVTVQNVKVDTSVRKHAIRAQLAVVNRQAAEVRARVRAAVQDAGRTAFTVGEQDITLKPGESRPLVFTTSWRHPRLWSWREPNLYVLAVEVTDAASGQQLDLTRERFGFRETWLQGAQIMFNGHPIRLKCISRPCVDAQAGRNAANPDYFDETGFLVSHFIAGMMNTSSRHNVASDAFWETARKNALAAAPSLWNHPSIFAWDLANEWYSFATYTGADMPLAARRFKTVANAVEALDPTRWTFFNGDWDLGGLHNTFSAHYMFAHPDLATGFDFDGHSTFLPDGAFFRPLERDFRKAEEITIHAGQHVTYRLGSKVIMDTENLWKVGGFMPPGPSKYVGEEEVLSSAIDGNAGPWIWMGKQNIDGQRDLGVSLHSAHEPWQGVVTRGHSIQTFIMPDTVHHGFAGRKLVRSYALLNDLFRPAKLALKWRLVGSDGQAVAKGADRRKLGSGETQRGALSFRLPTVAQRTKFTLQVRLESEGTFVCGEDQDIEVWPDTPILAGPLERKVLLFDSVAVPGGGGSRPTGAATGGATAAALRAAGVPFEMIQDLSLLDPRPSTLFTLIIGEGALNEARAAQMKTLGKFVEAGGRVLVLAQTVTPQGLPVRTILEPREWSSQPFVRVPIHPALEGISSWDLHFWAPDRVSARGAYLKPEGGASLALVDSGGEDGLEWVQLMELYQGSGMYLLCQLPVAGKCDEEPMARELLARLVSYAGGRNAFRAPQQRLRLVAARNSAVERRLKDVGASYDTVAPDAAMDGTAPIMVESGAIPAAAQVAAWKKGLANGATVVIVGSRPEDAGWLSELAGASVKLTVPRYVMWEGRGYRAAFDPLTAGLSHLDFYWKRYDRAESAGCQIENPKYMIEPLQDWAVSVEGGRELVFPGVLAAVNVGKGRLVLDQRRWTTAHEKLVRLAERNLASLLVGLNVRLAPVVSPPSLPENIAYKTVDLQPFCTRGFADEVGGDGKGGWCDQGPDLDLHAFPTGLQTFNGVPFLVGAEPRGCIVLRTACQNLSERLPDEAVIPFGYPAEALWFLHGAAYAGGGPIGLYEVQYADGTNTVIPLIAGENIRDSGSEPGPLPRERGTQSKVAWTGAAKMFPTVSVYQMLWVNPRPAVPIKAVRFDNPGRAACPILIAVTAGVKGEAPPVTADRAKAEALLAQAQRALDDKRDADAKGLLQQALALDGRLWRAHERLADVAERAGNDEDKLAVYRAWTLAGALSPEPFNRLGALLEKRKDYPGALAAYTQSLKIEWNQPPIIEAKSRLEKALKP
jgi:hypothetical protein